MGRVEFAADIDKEGEYRPLLIVKTDRQTFKFRCDHVFATMPEAKDFMLKIYLILSGPQKNLTRHRENGE